MSNSFSKVSQSPAATISIFLVLTSSLYAIGIWLVFRLGSATPLMLSVGLSAILTCLITRKSLRSLGWSWGSWKYQWFSYLVPLGYTAAAYFFIWVAGFGGWYNSEFVSEQRQSYKLETWSDSAVITFQVLLTATVSFILLLPSVLGEELGWRGLLVPELSKIVPFAGVALISGFFWAAWHWPLMIMGIHGNEITPFFYQLSCFTLCLMSMSVIITYIRLKTHSLWPAVVFHMSHNIFLQKYFDPITSANANSAWFLDEFGAVLPLGILILAVIYWRKGNNEFGKTKI